MNAVVPVVLAAGLSRRMGFPKALLPLGEGTFLTCILDKVQQLDLVEPIVVLGAHAAHIQPALAQRPVRVLLNQNFSLGQISSIRLAIENLSLECLGCLIWPVDHPSVSGNLVAELVRLFRNSEAPLVLPFYEGRRGHPAIVGRSLFQEVLEAPAEGGMKAVIQRHEDSIALLPTPESSTVLDIDTPGDYLSLTGESLEAALARAHR